MCFNIDGNMKYYFILMFRWSESNLNHPFDALLIAAYASDMMKSIPAAQSHSSYANTLKEVTVLTEGLKLEAAAKRLWDLPWGLEEVTSLGLVGIIWSRLSSTNERDMSTEVHTRIRPFARQFQGNPDKILLEWVVHAISSRVIVARLEDDYSSNEIVDVDVDGPCTLSILFVVVSLIVDVPSRAEAVFQLLLLLQSLQAPKDNASPDDATEDGVEQGGDAYRKYDIQSFSVKLITMAEEITRSDTTHAYDELLEAIRLQKLRTIAAKYSIVGLDVRNAGQVREAVYLIASRIHQSMSVHDAMEFLNAWSGASIDLSALLSRAVIVRSMSVLESDRALDDANQTAAENISRDKLVISVLNLVPANCRAALTNEVCNFFLCTLSDLRYAACKEGVSPGDLATDDDKREARQACHGAIIAISWYLDSLTTSETASVMNDPNDGWIDAELLSVLKRLQCLQLEFGIYLTVSELKGNMIGRMLAKQIAEKRANELLASNSLILEGTITPLTAVLRRACVLLGVSRVYAAHEIMRKLLATGSLVRPFL